MPLCPFLWVPHDSQDPSPKLSPTLKKRVLNNIGLHSTLLSTRGSIKHLTAAQAITLVYFEFFQSLANNRSKAQSDDYQALKFKHEAYV